MTTLSRIRTLSDKLGRKVLQREELLSILTATQLARLVRSGAIRQGVTGYYLREPPDPGARAVMERALRSTKEEDQ